MRGSSSHLLFGFTLVTLAALGTWWFIYFSRTVEVEKQAWLNELIYASNIAALMLGNSENAPTPGPIEAHSPLEIIARAQADSGDMFVAAYPRFPEFGVRPMPAVRAHIENRIGRRRWMVIGESGLMFVLLAVCTYMLYRFIHAQRRHNQRMESFVQAVSHEMKTPLTGVKSLLQTLQAGRVSDAMRPRLLAMGLKETERLEHMVRNILISGSLKADNYEMQLEKVSLRPFLQTFLEHRRSLLTGNTVQLGLDWQCASEELTVQVDSTALQVVLDNLTDNALKYGGTHLSLRVSHATPRVRLSLCDDGQGFAPELAEELFIPFRRALPGGHGVQHGTGLGLHIARSLAERMAGRLCGSSAGPGKGSEFVLELEEA